MFLSKTVIETTVVIRRLSILNWANYCSNPGSIDQKRLRPAESSSSPFTWGIKNNFCRAINHLRVYLLLQLLSFFWNLEISFERMLSRFISTESFQAEFLNMKHSLGTTTFNSTDELKTDKPFRSGRLLGFLIKNRSSCHFGVGNHKVESNSCSPLVDLVMASSRSLSHSQTILRLIALLMKPARQYTTLI